MSYTEALDRILTVLQAADQTLYEDMRGMGANGDLNAIAQFLDHLDCLHPGARDAYLRKG